jgi:hypothetical protein
MTTHSPTLLQGPGALAFAIRPERFGGLKTIGAKGIWQITAVAGSWLTSGPA